MRATGPTLLLLVLAGAPAAGEPVRAGREAPLTALVPAIHGRSTCFTRTYGVGHLALHPNQRVRAMSLRLRYHRHPADAADPQGQRNVYFQLSATVRGETARLVAFGECSADGVAITCEPDCDGGGFGLSREPDGSVRVDLAARGRLRMSRGCDGGDAGGVELKPGRDDRVFRLVPGAPCACGL